MGGKELWGYPKKGRAVSSKAYGSAPWRGTPAPAPSLDGQRQKMGRKYLTLETAVKLDALGNPYPSFLPGDGENR